MVKKTALTLDMWVLSFCLSKAIFFLEKTTGRNLSFLCRIPSRLIQEIIHLKNWGKVLRWYSAGFKCTTERNGWVSKSNDVDYLVFMWYNQFDKFEFDKRWLVCMSACRIIASDMPLTEFEPPQYYPLEINLDKGTIYDGGADDNYFLNAFANVHDYTEKKYGVSLEWHYTDGRAKQIIEYIKSALSKTDSVEFWLVWLMDYWEFENRPFVHKKTISIDELNIEHIKEMDNAVIWNTPDKMYPDRPSFYCLTVTR